MKTILYIVAILVGAAGCYFSLQNKKKHADELKSTNDTIADNDNTRRNIKKTIATKDDEVELRDAADKALKDTIADIEEVLQPAIRSNAKLSASYEPKIAAQQEKMDELNRALAEIQKIFEKENVEFEQIPTKIAELNDERKALADVHKGLLENVEARTESVTSNRAQIAEDSVAQAQRRASLKANGVSSLITAVDNDWGFVVIKPHPDAIINADSKLIVVRGSRHIGRLKINALEDKRVLANIDYSSLVAGLRIRPGDKVILSKPNTN